MNKLKTSVISSVLIAVFSMVISNAYAQKAWKPKYMGELHVGYGTTSKVKSINTYMGRVMLGTIHGIAFDKYGDVGIGVDGVMLTHYYRDHGMRFLVNPYLSVRPAYPLSDNFSVFLDCALGASIPVVNMKGGETEFTYQFGPGIKYKKLNLSLGMQSIGSGDGSITFFAKLGFYLGKQ